jgi:hypothetical protein
MAKKKPVLNKPPDISILISNVLKNIEAVKQGQPVNLDYLISFQVGMSLAKSLALLLPSEDHKTGFVSGVQSHFSFDIDNKVEASDKDPPMKKSDPEDGDDLPF